MIGARGSYREVPCTAQRELQIPHRFGKGPRARGPAGFARQVDASLGALALNGDDTAIGNSTLIDLSGGFSRFRRWTTVGAASVLWALCAVLFGPLWSPDRASVQFGRFARTHVARLSHQSTPMNLVMSHGSLMAKLAPARTMAPGSITFLFSGHTLGMICNAAAFVGALAAMLSFYWVSRREHGRAPPIVDAMDWSEFTIVPQDKIALARSFKICTVAHGRDQVVTELRPSQTFATAVECGAELERTAA